MTVEHAIAWQGSIIRLTGRLKGHVAKGEWAAVQAVGRELSQLGQALQMIGQAQSQAERIANSY